MVNCISASSHSKRRSCFVLIEYIGQFLVLLFEARRLSCDPVSRGPAVHPAYTAHPV